MGMVNMTKRNVSRIIGVSCRIIGYASKRIIHRIKNAPFRGHLIRVIRGAVLGWGAYHANDTGRRV